MRTHTTPRTHTRPHIRSSFSFVFCFPWPIINYTISFSPFHFIQNLVPELCFFFGRWWPTFVPTSTHPPTHTHTGYLSPTAKPPTKTPKKLPSLACRKTTTPIHGDGALVFPCILAFLHSCIPVVLFLFLFRLTSIRPPNKNKVAYFRRLFRTLQSSSHACDS